MSGTLVTRHGRGGQLRGLAAVRRRSAGEQPGLAGVCPPHRRPVAGLLITWQFLSAWKSQRSQIVLLPAATGVVPAHGGPGLYWRAEHRPRFPGRPGRAARRGGGRHVGSAGDLGPRGGFRSAHARKMSRRSRRTAAPAPPLEGFRHPFQAGHRAAAAGHHLCRHGRGRKAPPSGRR